MSALHLNTYKCYLSQFGITIKNLKKKHLSKIKQRLKQLYKVSWINISKNILVPAFLGVFGAPGSGAGSATEPLFEAHDDAQPLLVVTRHIDHNEEDDESDDQDGDDNTNRDTVLTFCCKGVQLTPNYNHIYLFFNNII